MKKLTYPKPKYLKNTTQIMRKKTKLIFTLLTLIAIVGGAVVASLSFYYQHKNNKVVATVNGEKIYQSELEGKLTAMLQDKNNGQKVAIESFPSQVIESLVQEIYLQKELDKIAKKSPVSRDKALKKQIENYQNNTLRQAYLDSIVNEKVTEQAIKDKYSEVSNEFNGKKEIHVKHILVSGISEAEKILTLLKKKSSSFEKLAKQYSKDDTTASLGGDLGYVIPDKLDEDFAKSITELKRNQISNPIKTKYGWHIIKVEDIRDVKLPAFEDIKISIENSLKQEEVEKVFHQITKDAKVKILIKLDPKEEVKTQEEVAETTAEKTEEKPNDTIKSEGQVGEESAEKPLVNETEK